MLFGVVLYTLNSMGVNYVNVRCDVHNGIPKGDLRVTEAVLILCLVG